jgi:hypothetical protein
MPFYVKYADKESIAEVRSEEDLSEFLLNILDEDSKEAILAFNLPKRYGWVYRIDAEEAI